MKSPSTATFVCAFFLGLAAASVSIAQAQTFSVFHNFTGSADGANPLNGLIVDSSGNLYGTASSGGATDNGTVFKIDTAGTATILHSFNGGADGQNPQSVLLRNSSGDLFGTTLTGGAHGAGTVFMVTPAGKESVLYSFTGGADGAAPQAGLTRDSAGNLYGTASAGGANANGVVFELVHPKAKGGAWSEQVLCSFGPSPDGAVPVAGVTFDSAGNLYGTASGGGTYGYGAIFELTPSASGWSETIIHSFQNADDGGVPYATLIYDKAGDFFGAATDGGTGGGGTIFKLTPGAGGWTFAVIYSNPGWGISGAFRHLALDTSGNLYGTTHCDGAYSAGSVYELTPANGTWTYTSLYEFTGGTDGLYSFSNPVLYQGAIYGTTNEGGSHSMGVVFKVVP